MEQTHALSRRLNQVPPVHFFAGVVTLKVIQVMADDRPIHKHQIRSTTNHGLPQLGHEDRREHVMVMGCDQQGMIFGWEHFRRWCFHPHRPEYLLARALFGRNKVLHFDERAPSFPRVRRRKAGQRFRIHGVEQTPRSNHTAPDNGDRLQILKVNSTDPRFLQSLQRARRLLSGRNFNQIYFGPIAHFLPDKY
jgi:hypothetical protein